MRPAQRTGTTHPARPADHFLKSPRYSKIRHFSPHLHTIIRYPQSQTLSTLRYHPLIFIRSLTQQNTARSLQVHRNCSHSYTTSLSNPTKAKLRTAQAPLNHSRTRNKSSKAWTHTRRKGFNNKRTMYQHSNGFRA